MYTLIRYLFIVLVLLLLVLRLRICMVRVRRDDTNFRRYGLHEGHRSREKIARSSHLPYFRGRQRHTAPFYRSDGNQARRKSLERVAESLQKSGSELGPDRGGSDEESYTSCRPWLNTQHRASRSSELG